MVAIEEVTVRLEKLKKYVSILKEYQTITAEELKKDFKVRAIVERYFQLATECCIDVAEIIISAKELRMPHDAHEAIDILGEEGIIEDKFAYEFSRIVNFRNILVHDYLDIDYTIVVKNLQNNLGDFDIFTKQVAKNLQTNI